jgi:tetratricopeptide (TPR) repeat protein
MAVLVTYLPCVGQIIGPETNNGSPAFGENSSPRIESNRGARDPDRAGSFVSGTSLTAPPDARKAYEQAAWAMWSKKWRKAEPLLRKAVALHPLYAAAWYRLGLCYQHQNRLTEARAAYVRALDAEPKYPDVHCTLATLAWAEEQWSAVRDHTERAIRLDSAGFPGAYYMNAMANLRLNNPELAATSARDGLRIDTAHRVPKLEQILALALARSSNHIEAEEHLRLYLKLERDPAERELARRQLAAIQHMSGK